MDQDKVDDELLLSLLKRWHAGDRNALAELTPIVYLELHRLATQYMRRERSGHTLQATALVNEAFMRLGRGLSMSFADKAHFYGVAATLMRHILVDHAKARVRVKRGGGGEVKSLSEADEVAQEQDGKVIELDEALAQLKKRDANAAQTLELHYFGGMTIEQTGEALGVSSATVGRTIRFAKAWLLRQLQPVS